MKTLNSKQKKKLFAELEELYGVPELNYQLIETGKKRIRAFSGNLTTEEIQKIPNVELIGMYLISQKDAEPRLSFDSVSLLKEKITKNIIEIDEKQFEQWIRGYDLSIETQKGTIVIKYNNDLIGIGKSNGEKVFNYIPKERKLKTPLK